MISMIALTFCLYPKQVQAETLGDVKKKLAQLEKEYAEQEADANQTKDKINTNNQTVEQLKKEVSQ